MSQRNIMNGLVIVTLALVVWFAGPLGMPNIAYAQPITPTGNDLSGFAQTASVILTFLHLLTIPVFYLLALLLNPNTFLAINNTGLLQTLWQLSRDIMNIIFAFLLIGSALITIVRTDQPGQFLKDHASKFILTVILINFSWFFPRVILDVSSILTATVYTLADTVGGECITTDIDGNQVPCTAVTGFTVFSQNPDADPNLARLCPQGWTMQLDQGLLWICQEELDSEFRQNAPGLHLLNGLVMNHSRLLHIPFIRTGANNIAGLGARNQLGQLLELLMRVLIALAFQVAIAFPLIALLVAFFIRIPVLWFTIAFMPFAALGFVIQVPGNFDPKEKIMNTFLKVAFLPFVTGIPISVGYIMITAGMNAQPSNALSQLTNMRVDLLQGVGTVWELLWFLLALFVIYGGVFAALDLVNDVPGMGVIQNIKNAGQQFGSFAMKAPLQLPILPVAKNSVLDDASGQKGDGRASFNDLLNLGGRAASKLNPANQNNNNAPNFTANAAQQRAATNAARGINNVGQLNNPRFANDLKLIREMMERGGIQGNAIDRDSLREALRQGNANQNSAVFNNNALADKFAEAVRNAPRS